MAIVTTMPCSDFGSSKLKWLWKPYIPQGKIVLLDGDPGTGKSFVAIDLAARLSCGGKLPDGQALDRPHTTLLLSAEDDATDTILPRVRAAGADLSRIHIVASLGYTFAPIPQFPADLPSLERAAIGLKADLIVVDPMMPFFPREVWVNSDQCVRQALTPFATMAANTGCTVLLIRHITKSGGARAIYRGSGSMGIIGAARTGLMLGRHPDDPELRVLSVVKTNIGKPGSSLGFRFAEVSLPVPAGESVSAPSLARPANQNDAEVSLAGRASDGVSDQIESSETKIEWLGPVDLSADDLCSAKPSSVGNRPRDRAKTWLKSMLAKGGVKASELFTLAAAAGIAEKTLYRAKELSNVIVEQVREEGQSVWYWHDPEVSNPNKYISELPPLEDVVPGYKARLEEVKARRRKSKETCDDDPTQMVNRKK